MAPKARATSALWVTLFACLLGGLVLLGHRYVPLTTTFWQSDRPIPYQFADSERYIPIAMGHIDEVPSPYCKRVLFPLIAGCIWKGLNIPLPLAFADLNYVAFILMAFCLAKVAEKTRVSGWWVVFALMTPTPLEALQRGYLPDLFYIFLLSVFFLLLANRLEIWSLIVLFVAFLTRDNTIILCLVLIAIGWSTQRRRMLVGGTAVLFLGLICESYFTHLGQPNRHHMPDFLYMAFLVPCSFFGNVLGIVLWTNAGGADGTPLYHWHIPRALQFGADHDAYAAYRFFRQAETFAALLTLFGCAPLIVAYLWNKAGRLAQWPLVIQIAFCYGLICYFLGTTVGRAGTFRLIGYSWPLFWIAMPYLLARAKLPIRPAETAMLVIASAVAIWTPNLEGLEGPNRVITAWLFLIPAMWIFSMVVLRRIGQRQNGEISTR